MEGRNTVGPVLPGAAVLLLVITGIAAYTTVSLNSHRPNSDPWGGVVYGERQILVGRLWEDSLLKAQQHFSKNHDAVMDHLQVFGAAKSFEQIDNAALESAREIGGTTTIATPESWPLDGVQDLDKAAKITLLPVFVEGTHYPDDQEQRRRSRYAVVSALIDEGFSPEQGEEIRYLLFEGQKKVDPYRIKADLTDPTIIPFEWFSRAFAADTRRREFVLVLWLDDLRFRFRPEPGKTNPHQIEMLERICAKLQAGILGFGRGADPALWSIRILGPRSSTALRTMVEEVKTRLAANEVGRFPSKSARMYSPWATVDAGLLVESVPAISSVPPSIAESASVLASVHTAVPQKENFNEKALNHIFDCFGMPFERIGHDGDLTKALVEELDLRDINVSEVLLISEQDTLYGKSFAKSFGLDPKKEYHYQRGLDGDSLPVDPAQNKSRNTEVGDNGATSNAGLPGWSFNGGSSEKAWGLQQADYVRRLADQISGEQQVLYRTTDSRIKAIGIVGNDVFDKLMLLQALRPLFPGCVFFTTDLESEFMSRSSFQYTHNLVVASHRGLSPELIDPQTSESNRKFIPFRSSYQSAMYSFATQAVNPDVKYVTPISVFEVGRSGAIKLSPRGQEGMCSRLKRSRFAGWILIVVGAFVVAVLPASGVYLRKVLAKFEARTSGSFSDSKSGLESTAESKPSAASGDTTHTAESEPEREREIQFGRGMIVILGFVGLIVALAALLDSNWDKGEPFLFFEGVSIWPTVVLRVITIFLAYQFFVVAKFSLADRLFRVADYLGPDRNSRDWPVHEQRTSFKERFNTWLEWFWALDKTRTATWWKACVSRFARDWDWRTLAPENKKYDLATLWIGYYNNERRKDKRQRIVGLLCIHVAVYALVYEIGDDYFQPYRGTISQLFDTSAQYFVTILLLLINVFTLDTLMICRALVDSIRHRITDPLRSEEGRDDTPKEVAANKNDPSETVEIACMNSFHRVELVGSLTQTISPFVYYSFGMLLLGILARNPYFDNYDWPASVAILLGIMFGSNLLALVLLQHSARQLKHREQMLLREMKLRPGGRDECRKHLDEARGYIDQYNRGAFLPVMEDPLIRALAFPLTGAGGMALLQYLLTRV